MHLRGNPKGSPYHTGYFAGDYRTEVVHYGPFFVPTGKNVFNCDGASTYSFFLPRDVDGVLFSVLSPAVFIGAFGLAVGTVLTTAYLTLGGGFLLVRGSERSHRLVGLAAVLAGLLVAATTFFCDSHDGHLRHQPGMVRRPDPALSSQAPREGASTWC